nr:phage tail tip lysozyme [uncultured Pseudomonas sp.]
MANTFTITIDAVDKATATVRKVNDSINRLTRPFEEVGKSFKGLGRELGFEKIGKNLGNIGREASTAARGIGSIVAPMAAITGIGSVAGIAALASNWANLGRSIDNSAHSIGISTGQLQSFRGAAKMVGVDAADTTSSLDNLATTMQDAQWGRNQGALMMFNKLGIGLKKTKEGAWDVVGQYKAVANAIAKEADPQKQKLIARAFGMEGMLPFLREGAVGIERYETMVKRLGYVMSEDAVKRGKEFSQSLAGLGVAVDGTKNAIGDKLIPVMKPLIDEFTNWVGVNRELIATNIGDWAKGFATWIGKIDWKKVGDGIANFGKGVGKVVDWLGGWENAAILVIGVMNAGLIGSVLSLGMTLGRAGFGILSFIGLLGRWKGAANAAAVAQNSLITGQGVSWLASGAAVGLTTAAVGAGAMLYSPSLNQGEDEAVRRIRASQGLPENEPKTPKLDALAGAWNKVQGTNKDTANFAQDYFQSQGWSKQAAAGIVGNGIAESNLDPTALGDWGRARGIFQWHRDRQDNFEKWAGFSMMDPRADTMKQLEFANYELTQGTESSAGSKLRGAKTAEEAGAIASRSWLRPGTTEEAKDREASARAALARVLEGPVTSAASPTSQDQPVAPKGPYNMGNVPGPTNGKVKVEVDLKGATEGTKVSVQSEGNVQGSSRIAYTGVGGGV